MELPEALELEFRQDLERLEQEGQMPYISSIERRAMQDAIHAEIESLLEAKFGELDEPLRAIVDPLGNLPISDRARMILQMSKEELIDQFQSSDT